VGANFRGAIRRARERTFDYVLVRALFADRNGAQSARGAAALLARHQVCTCLPDRGGGPCCFCIHSALAMRGVLPAKAMWRPADRGATAFMLWNAYLENAARHAAVLQSLENDRQDPCGPRGASRSPRTRTRTL
jgi:hypothetical protein